jgi:hypothetical protein
MRLPAFTFRILLPSLYLSSWGLLIVGAVLTIAEGPNPFFFLVFASAPGSYLFQLINLLLPIASGNLLVTLLLGVLFNLGIYFVVGYLIDYAIKRRRGRKLAPTAQAASIKSSEDDPAKVG